MNRVVLPPLDDRILVKLSHEWGTIFIGVIAWLALVVCCVLFGHFLSRLDFFGSIGRAGDNASRTRALDGVRGFLALSVVAHHCRLWYDFSRTLIVGSRDVYLIFAAGGKIAVPFFFMISGAVFYPRLRTRSCHSWSEFYILRVARIVPLYCFLVLSVAVIILACHFFKSGHFFRGSVVSFCHNLIEWLLFSSSTIDIDGEWLTDWRFFAGTPHTLRSEWKFYFLLPIFDTFVALCLIAHIPLVFALLILFLSTYFVQFTFISFYGLFPYFVLGMLAQEIALLAKERKGLVERLISSDFSLLASLTCLLVSALTTDWQYKIQGLFDAFILLCIVTCLCYGTSCFRIFSNQGSVFLGQVSYSVYLLQGPVFFVFFEILGVAGYVSEIPFFAVATVVALVCVFVSAFTFKYIEVPSQISGKNLASRGRMLDEDRQHKSKTFDH